MALTPEDKKKISWMSAISVVVIVITLAIALPIAGYHISGLDIVKGGNLDVSLASAANASTSVQDIAIFLNGQKEQGTNFSNLKPGSYDMITSASGTWPWRKQIDVTSGSTTIARPFLVPTDLTGSVIPKTNAQYYPLRRAIYAAVLPNAQHPLTSSDKSIAVWADGDTIYASSSATAAHVVLSAATPIRDMSFYKTRDDVILIAASNGIYALELNANGGQNFQPIYTGVTPYFMIGKDGKIYIDDKGNLIQGTL